jgi:filamentous hemagglutinin
VKLDSTGAVVTNEGNSSGGYDQNDRSTDNGDLTQVTATSKSGGLITKTLTVAGLHKNVKTEASSSEGGSGRQNWQGAGFLTNTTDEQHGIYLQSNVETTNTQANTYQASSSPSANIGVEGGVYMTVATGNGTVTSTQGGTRDAVNTTDITGVHGNDRRSYLYNTSDDSTNESTTNGYYASFNGAFGATGALTAGSTLALSKTTDTDKATLHSHNAGLGSTTTRLDATPATDAAPTSARIRIDSSRVGIYDSLNSSSATSDGTTAGVFQRVSATTASAGPTGALPGSTIGGPPVTIGPSLSVPNGPGLTGSVSAGCFKATSHSDESTNSAAAGIDSTIIHSDLTTITPAAAPPAADGSATTPASPTTTGSATVTSSSGGVSSLAKSRNTNETYLEYGIILKGAATANANTSSATLTGGASGYAALYRQEDTSGGSLNYSESGGGNSKNSVTTNANGDTTVAGSSGWTGVYSLASSDSSNNTYVEKGVGLTVVGSLQPQAGQAGGSLTFLKRDVESGSGSLGSYSDAGVILRSGKQSGTNVFIGQSSTTLIGAYKVKQNSWDQSHAAIDAFQVTVSGAISADPASLFGTDAVGIGGSGSLSYAKIEVVDDSTNDGSHEEVGGRSEIDGVATSQDAAGAVTTRTTSNASQVGVYKDASKGKDTEHAESLGGAVGFWASAAGGVTGSASGGLFGASVSGSAAWGFSETTTLVEENLNHTTSGTEQGTVVAKQASDSCTATKPATSTSSEVITGTYTATQTMDDDADREDDQHSRGHNASGTAGVGVTLGWDGIGISYGSTTTTGDSQGHQFSHSAWHQTGTFVDKGGFVQTTTNDAAPATIYTGGRSYTLVEGLDEEADGNGNGTWGSTTNAGAGPVTTTGGWDQNSDSDHEYTHSEAGALSPNANQLMPTSATFDDTRVGSSHDHTYSAGNGSTADHTDDTTTDSVLHQEGTGQNAAWTYDAGSNHSTADKGSSASAMMGTSSWTSWSNDGSHFHSEGGPGGATGYSDMGWSMGWTSTSPMMGTTSGGMSGSSHTDGAAVLVPLFAGRSFSTPQTIDSDGMIWGMAVAEVGCDVELMTLNGATFGQIPALRAREGLMRARYGDLAYEALYVTGATGTLALVAAATVASGGTLAPILIGAGIGGVLGAGRQFAEMLDGTRTSFDITAVADSAALGGIMGSLYQCSFVSASVLRAAQGGFLAMQVAGGLNALA